MPITDKDRRVGIFAGSSGLIQASFFVLVSCILLVRYYQGVIVNTNQNPILLDNFEVFYIRFLDSNFSNILDYSATVIVTPTVFVIFTWLYLILDLCWFFISGYLLINFIIRTEELSRCLRLYSTITFIICVLDFLATFCLIVDYCRTCTGSLTDLQDRVRYDAMIPALLFSAKAIVAWIMNVITAGALKELKKLLEQDADPSNTTDSESTPLLNSVRWLSRRRSSNGPPRSRWENYWDREYSYRDGRYHDVLRSRLTYM